MRKPIIVGNWKMHHLQEETRLFVEEVEEFIDTSTMDIGIAPSFLSLEIAQKNAKKLIIAAQDCHYAEQGAYTGEISVSMLKDIGISWCIIGHSERRRMFGDDDERVNRKIRALLEKKMNVIVCVGESEEAFEKGKTEEVLCQQIEESLRNLLAEDVQKLVIAYEPLWAIGTGKSANKEIAEKCCLFIRSQIQRLFGEEAAQAVRLQYGGSVKAENIREYLAQENIDGALVGKASLQATSFVTMLEMLKEKE